MKLVKTFGLAVVAAIVLVMSMGASSASATAICMTATHPCTEPYAVGTKIKAQTGTQKQSLKDRSLFGEVEIDCESILEGEITKNPGETTEKGQHQAEGKITSGSLPGCQPACSYELVQLPWRVHINWTEGQRGIMWVGPWEGEATPGKETWEHAPGLKITGFCVGSGCVFHAHETQTESFGKKYAREWVQGSIEPSPTKTITFNQVQLTTSCGGEALWSSLYHVGEPATEMYISE